MCQSSCAEISDIKALFVDAILVIFAYFINECLALSHHVVSFLMNSNRVPKAWSSMKSKVLS